MKIYCCGCEKEVEAKLVSGKEIYPHRPDLNKLPFLHCKDCGNYVGCHHKTKNRTRPLGVIPTHEIREYRKKIHATIDPIWKSKEETRAKVYSNMSDLLGYKFHTADIRSLEEAKDVYFTACDLKNLVYGKGN